MNIHDDLKLIGFLAPDRFWNLDPDKWGGCGPGKWGDPFVPDHIFGMNIKPCCAAHDVSWEIAVENQSMDDKYQGDFEFYLNMKKFAVRDSYDANFIINWFRFKFVRFYFDRVWDYVPRKLRGVNEIYHTKDSDAELCVSFALDIQNKKSDNLLLKIIDRRWQKKAGL